MMKILKYNAIVAAVLFIPPAILMSIVYFVGGDTMPAYFYVQAVWSIILGLILAKTEGT